VNYKVSLHEVSKSNKEAIKPIEYIKKCKDCIHRKECGQVHGVIIRCLEYKKDEKLMI